MSDIIRIHDLRRLARHGVYDEERAEGRRFAVDVEATVATAEAGRSDALGDTVD
ncbi:MAG: dihydroneopterin aldolase, partial [Planctomycetes bacterium]|nr:dihydroneopterin aldolase [Planctomycetota bacterium]